MQCSNMKLRFRGTLFNDNDNEDTVNEKTNSYKQLRTTKNVAKIAKNSSITKHEVKALKTNENTIN